MGRSTTRATIQGLPPFVALPLGAIDDGRLDGPALNVVAAVLSYADYGRGTGCWASQATLAKAARLTVQSLRIKLKMLRATGWLTWKKTPGSTLAITVNYENRRSERGRRGVETSFRGGESLIPPHGIVDSPTESPLPRALTESSARPKRAPSDTWLTPYYEAWKTVYRTEPTPGRLAAGLKPVQDELGETETQRRWLRYLRRTPLAMASPHRFAETHEAYTARTWRDVYEALLADGAAEQGAQMRMWHEEHADFDEPIAAEPVARGPLGGAERDAGDPERRAREARVRTIDDARSGGPVAVGSVVLDIVGHP